jgi:hypothetical protein
MNHSNDNDNDDNNDNAEMTRRGSREIPDLRISDEKQFHTNQTKIVEYCDKCQDSYMKCAIYKNKLLCDNCYFDEVFVYCEECSEYLYDKDKRPDLVDTLCAQCLEVNEMLSKYSEEQRQSLHIYAQAHGLTIAEAIEYQICCHSCGREVDDGLFDGVNHQYCRQRCFDYCEEYQHPCFREANCSVCSIWHYRENRRQQEIRSREVVKQMQVLMTIEVFKEIQVYGSLLACVPDLSEYFV